MRAHLRKVGTRARRLDKHPGRPALRTLVLLLPRFRNPDSSGLRQKIELHKWKMTLREIERICPGYQRFHVKGWNREDNVRDDLYRFEADLLVTPANTALIRGWKNVLARRFEQREIYIRSSGRVTWL